MRKFAALKFASFKQPKIQKILIGLYVLVILGISATVRAEIPHEGLRTYTGEVVWTMDNKFYLVNEDQTKALELRSSEDLSGFNGYVVTVVGEELKHMVGPVVTISSTDPLQMDEVRTPAVPVVLVFDIGVEKHLGIETK